MRGSGGNRERERKGSGGKQGQRGGTKGRVEKLKRGGFIQKIIENLEK